MNIRLPETRVPSYIWVYLYSNFVHGKLRKAHILKHRPNDRERSSKVVDICTNTTFYNDRVVVLPQ